jgi:hypothetical protein
MNKREVADFGLMEVDRRFRREGFQVTKERYRGRTRLHARRELGRSYEVRVATMRRPRGNYAFFTNASFKPSDGLLAALILLEEGRDPKAFLIPSTAWHQPSPLLRDREYQGKASAPEWGISVSGKSRPLLEEFRFGVQSRLL